jgi:hypothetical protein
MKFYTCFFICSLLFTACCAPLFAQEIDYAEKQQNLNNLGTNNFRGVVRTYNEGYEGVKGHPYFIEEWTTGNVLLENEQQHNGLQLKYNVHKDLLLLQRRGTTMMLDKKRVRAFSLGVNDAANMANFVKAFYLEHDLPGIDNEKFVQVLYEGGTSLYAVNYKPFDRADGIQQGGYGQKQNYDEFEEMQATYFFAGPDGVKKLKGRKNQVLRALGDKDKQLKKYIDDNQLDLKDRTDLVELIMFYENQMDR